MISPKKQYQHLKQEAMRLMWKGDLQRYLRKLRELNELRPALKGVQGMAG